MAKYIELSSSKNNLKVQIEKELSISLEVARGVKTIKKG